MSQIELNMKKAQNDTMAKPFYMTSQSGGVTEGLRASAVNWVLRHHLKWKLWPETMFITINLVDRHLSEDLNFDTKKMYLLASTSLLIAGKYEEIDPPTIRDIIKVTHSKFSRD
jgi:hypothetical protein